MILLIVVTLCLVGSSVATNTTSQNNTNIHDTINDEVINTSLSSTSYQTTSNSINSTNNNDNQINSITSEISLSSSNNSKTLSTATVRNTTKTTVSSFTTYPGKKVVINATVKTTTGVNVKGGEVVFKINGKTIGKTNVTNGVAKLTYTIPSTWTSPTYTLTAKYIATSEYYNSTVNGTIKLNNVTKTTISVTNINAYASETITLKASVLTSKGEKINTGKVAFKINGKTVATATVSKGQATAKYTIPTTWTTKSYQITVVYGQYGQYKESTTTGILKVTQKVNTKITTVAPSTYPGKKVVINATVKTTTGVNVKGGEVVFKINGKTIGKTNVTNGVAKLTYTIPSTWTSPTYTLTAKYVGSTPYYNSIVNGTIKLNNVTKTIVSVTNVSAYTNDNVTFKASVLTSKGEKINTGKVAFKINGVTIGTASVSNGQATITYKLPTSWTTKSYQITVVYGHYGQYKESTGTGVLKVSEQQYSEYLQETKNCQVTSSTIKKIAAMFSNYTNTLSKAKAIFNYLNSKIQYSSYYNTRYGAVGTYNRGYGNCVDMAHLLIAVSRASGIPARYNHATCTFRSGLVTGHVWAELYVNGVWYKCDLTSKSNSFGNIVNWKKCGTIKKYISLPF